MKKLYFLIAAMLVSTVASAATVDIWFTKWDDELEDYEEQEDPVEATATIKDHTVTIENFLESGNSITFKCLTDGTVYHNWTAGWNSGSYTFGDFGTYTYVYLYGTGSGYDDAEYVDDEDGKYITFECWAGNYEDYYYFYIDLPDDFTPATELYSYSGTANVTAYKLVDGVETGDAIAETLGISINDTTLSITNAFGYTSLASYLAYVIDVEKNSVSGLSSGYFTKSNAYTFNGETYSRLYVNSCAYDSQTNTFIWGVGLSANGTGSDLVNYLVYIPLPDEFAAGVNDITVDEANADGPVQYFNLQGIRVANPSNGLYIRRQGNTATKVLIK